MEYGNTANRNPFLPTFRQILINHQFKMPEALAFIETHTPDAPLTPKLFSIIAQELLDRGMPVEAREVSDAGINKFPRDIGILERRAMLEEDIGDREKSREFIERVKLRQKARHLYGKGVSEAEVNNYGGALKLFLGALELEPTDSYTLDRVTRTCLELGEWDLAIEYGERAVEIEPHFADHYYKLAMAFIKVGEFDHAFDALEQLLEGYKNNMPPHLNDSGLLGALELQKRLAQTGLTYNDPRGGNKATMQDAYWHNVIWLAEAGAISPQKKESFRINPYQEASLDPEALQNMPVGSMKRICNMLSPIGTRYQDVRGDSSEGLMR